MKENTWLLNSTIISFLWQNVWQNHNRMMYMTLNACLSSCHLPQFMPLASVHAARLTKIKACFEDLQCVCGHGYQPCAQGQGSGGRDGKACEKPHSARPLDRNVQIGLTPQRTQAAQGRAYEYKNDINGDTRQLKRPLAVTASSPPVAYFTVRVPPFQSGSNERTE